MKHSRTLTALFAIILLSLIATPTAATEGVSPGALDRLAQVNNACPTFSWGAVDGAQAYEIIGYALPEGTEQEVELSPDHEVLYTNVSGAATSWTPSADQCFAPGGRYVWFVRSVTELSGDQVIEASEWSVGRYFTVPEAPSPEEMQRALDVIRKWEASAGSGVSAIPSGTGTGTGTGTDSGSGTGSGLGTSHRKSVPTASAAIRGDNPETDVEAYGVVGSSASVWGAGVAAVNTEGGADLVLDGSIDGMPDTRISEWGIDRSDPTDQVFTMTNSGGGAMILDVMGTVRGTDLECPGCVASSDITDGTIIDNDLADDSVTESKIEWDAVNSNHLQLDAVTSTTILDGTIAAVDLAGDAVTAAAIADGAIGGDQLAFESVGEVHLADEAVTNAKIAAGAVESVQLANNVVTSAKIADGGVTGADLADESVGPNQIELGGVQTAHIDAGAVGAGQLADNAVTSQKIADGAVTAAKLAPGAIGAGSLADGSVTSATIANGTIAAIDLVDSAVTGSKLADGSVQSAKLGPGAVSTGKLLNGAVTNDKLSMNAVTASRILDGSIVGADLADGAVSATKLGLNSVTAGHIVDGTITAADLDPLGGTYSSRASIYEVTHWYRLDAGATGTTSTGCRDMNDLPLQGGCGGVSENVVVHGSTPKDWELGSSPEIASFDCTIENSGTIDLLVPATIICIDVPGTGE